MKGFILPPKFPNNGEFLLNFPPIFGGAGGRLKDAFKQNIRLVMEHKN
ncbi:hypothetical protein [Synechocystis sp. CACIAM 05]|nr:hypothetical protein [Synechocystis sp. CACIAM 05]